MRCTKDVQKTTDHRPRHIILQRVAVACRGSKAGRAIVTVPDHQAAETCHYHIRGRAVGGTADMLEAANPARCQLAFSAMPASDR